MLRARAGVIAVAAVLVATVLAGCSSAPSSSGAAAISRHATAGPSAGPARSSTPTPVDTVTATNATGVTDAACSSTPAGVDQIYVSISQQLLWACAGPALFTSTAVTTGASGLTNVNDATPVGTWHILGKVRNTVLRGHDANGSWRDPVAYWMPFHGAYGFHDASWQTFPFGGAQYVTEGSHGCVHVPVDELGLLYNWAPIGTAVTIGA